MAGAPQRRNKSFRGIHFPMPCRGTLQDSATLGELGTTPTSCQSRKHPYENQKIKSRTLDPQNPSSKLTSQVPEHPNDLANVLPSGVVFSQPASATSEPTRSSTNFPRNRGEESRCVAATGVENSQSRSSVPIPTIFTSRAQPSIRASTHFLGRNSLGGRKVTANGKSSPPPP